MKSLALASVSVTSALATGVLLVVTGAEVAVALTVQQSVGPDTPISGVTVGVVTAGIIAGMAFLWQGAKQMFALGKYIATLTSSLDEYKRTIELMGSVSHQVDQNAKHIAENTEAIAALERWRSITDPILVELQMRAGLRSRPQEGEAS